MDRPGKDTYRHRQAGAREVLVASSRRWALLHEVSGDEPSLPELLAKLSPVDLVLVEGFKSHPFAKLEVHRPMLGKPPIWPEQPQDPTGIVAVAADAALLGCDRIVLSLNDPARVGRLDCRVVSGACYVRVAATTTCAHSGPTRSSSTWPSVSIIAGSQARCDPHEVLERSARPGHFRSGWSVRPVDRSGGSLVHAGTSPFAACAWRWPAAVKHPGRTHRSRPPRTRIFPRQRQREHTALMGAGGDAGAHTGTW